jgi:hypothetical protein
VFHTEKRKVKKQASKCQALSLIPSTNKIKRVGLRRGREREGEDSRRREEKKKQRRTKPRRHH